MSLTVQGDENVPGDCHGARSKISPGWFYALLALYFVVMTSFGLHGSSLTVYAAYFGSGDAPLIGTAKVSRSDEWNIHTPAILNQLFREPPVPVENTAAGPDRASLLWNIPVKHPLMLFRPQFWAFFALPPERAFSIYWQLKTVLLLAGVFALLHLITQSAALSATLALFFYFSTHLQWAFSWPSAFPEAIGSACLAVTLTCRSMMSRNIAFMFAAAIGAGILAVNFALCAYAPHLVVVAWVAFFVLLWWFSSRWREIADARFIRWRLAALCVSASVVLIGMALFYVEAREAIATIINTVYPGRRRQPGGTASIIRYGSHFLDFWKTEESAAVPFQNIVEGTGFLWFGPLTLLFAGWLAPGPTRILYFILIGLFATLSIWIFLPIPAWAGHLVGLDLVGGARQLPAMGLLNALILGAFLRSYALEEMSARTVLAFGLIILAFFAVVLFAVDHQLALNLGRAELAASSLFAAAVMVFILARWRVALAISLVVPLFAANGLVNPVGRGLDVITHSSLMSFLDEHPDLRRKKWIVFSGLVQPNYFSAHGLDVLNSLRVAPELSSFRKLDPEGKFFSIYNSSAFVIVEPQDPSKDVAFATLQPGIVRLMLSPGDRRLRDLGISVLAFPKKPPEQWTADLKPIGSSPVDGHWLYEIP